MRRKQTVFSRRTWLIIGLGVLLAVGLALLFRLATNHITDKVTNSLSVQYSMELNAQMTAHISSTLDSYFHELNTQYQALKLIEALNEKKLTQFIADTVAANGLSYLAFADTRGYIYESKGSYLGTMRVHMLGDLLRGAKRLVGDNETIGTENYVILGTSFEDPILMGDRGVCVAILGMNNESLSDHIVLQSDYSGSYSSIIHVDGSYVIKHPAEPYSGLNVFSILSKNGLATEEALSQVKEALRRNESYMLYTAAGAASEPAYLYFAPIEGTEWYLINTLPAAFIKNSIVGLRDMLELVFILLIGFFLLLAAAVILQQMISGRKLERSQAELEKALQVAKEASEAKTDFLFSMSHDIRTPMNAILGYTDIGLKNVQNPALSEDSYRKIRSAGNHLLALMNDILEMSRLESGKLVLIEEPVDLRAVAEGISAMSESLAAARSIHYETILGDLPDPWVYADELHISEAIVNLISNAVKYTPEGGEVRFTVSQAAPRREGKAVYRFEVKDNGIGISEAFQARLFDAFSREESASVAKTEGSGLGLSIVKKIVDMAGGEIHVESEPGKGSVFTVNLPFRVVEEARPAGECPPAENAEEITLQGKKVLLVEDNELNREIAVYLLENAGLAVDTAEDGQKAVEAVLRKGVEYYDFILMDIQMPVMNGYEASKSIRLLPGGEQIPIIALSANAFEEDKQKSLAAGMDAHIAKPLDMGLLLKAMQKAAAQRGA